MKRFSSAIILSLLTVISLANCTGNGGAEETVTAMPADSVLTAGGQQVPVFKNFASLAPIFEKQNDTTYVINFWATWCKPCVEELPYFEQLQQKYAGEKMRIILVSLDFEKALASKLIPFLEEHRLKSDVMVLLDGDYNAWIDRVDPQWGGAIPVTVVYKAADRTFHGQQFANFEELDKIVNARL